MPQRPQSRTQVLEARAGESEYIRYDRAIAGRGRPLAPGGGARRAEAVVPLRGLRLAALPARRPGPVLEPLRSRRPAAPGPARARALVATSRARAEAPAGGARRPVRRGHGAERDARLLRARVVPRRAGRPGAGGAAGGGPPGDTRVIYSTDHGEMLGEHGLWWKSAMYESAVAVPLIVAGPDVPAGQDRRDERDARRRVSLDPGGRRSPRRARGSGPARPLALGARPRGRPGPGRRSASTTRSSRRAAIFMVRTARYKYVHYVGYPGQLFDLDVDPEETTRPRGRTRRTPTSGSSASGSSGPSAIRTPWTDALGPISAAASRRPAAPPLS